VYIRYKSQIFENIK